MKIIILLLILAACGPKDKFQEIPYTPKKSLSTLSTDPSWSKYSPQIDIMVAFLWPKKVKITDREKLAEIIQTSRDLKSQKEDYLLQKGKIQKEFNLNQCACVINFECTGEEKDLNEAKCYEIEEKIYANDKKLVPIFGLVESIKANVLAIGGEWLKTHLDFRELPNSSVDFSSLKIKFSVLDAYENNPLSYEVDASLTQEPFFQKLNSRFERYKYISETEKVPYGEWKVEAAAVASEASLLFQGKLFWIYQGVEHEGLIYWEHPAKD